MLLFLGGEGFLLLLFLGGKFLLEVAYLGVEEEDIIFVWGGGGKGVGKG